MNLSNYFVVAAIATGLLLTASDSEAYWGIRDVDEDSAHIDSVNAQSIIFNLSWAECEPEPGEFDWTRFDSLVTLCQREGMSLMIAFDIAHPAYTRSERWAPEDTDFERRLQSAVPDSGYSPSLYRFTWEYCRRHVTLRGENRSGPSLILGDLPDREWHTTAHDIDGYIRCLRTMRKAMEDFDANQRYMRFNVLMGAFDFSPILELEWFALGEAEEGLKDSLLALENQFHARDRLHFEDWDGFADHAGSASVIVARNWAVAMASEWRNHESYNFKYTFDPKFLKSFTAVLQRYIRDAGGHDRSTFSTYSALVLEEGSQVQFTERLHLHDYLTRTLQSGIGSTRDVRKLFCLHFPLIDSDRNRIYGLLNRDGVPYPMLQAAFRSMENTPWPISWSNSMDSSYQRINFFRFVDIVFDAPSHGTDYIWLQEPLPEESETTRIGITRPVYYVEDWGYTWDNGHWVGVYVLNLDGDTLDDITDRFDWNAEGEAANGWIDISTEPIKIIWYGGDDAVNDQDNLTPSGFEITDTYPNPFNSSIRIEYQVNRPGKFRLELIGLDGRKLKERELGVLSPGLKAEVLSQPDLPSGEYLIRLSDPTNAVYRKVILLK